MAEGFGSGQSASDFLSGVLGVSIIEGFGDLDKEEQAASSRWFHVPNRGEMDVVMLSFRPSRCQTHWVGNGHRPCKEDETCIYCERGVGYQVRYGFSVLRLSDRQRGNFELGPSPCKVISAELRSRGFLRGLGFRFRKEGGKLRGAILVEALGMPLPDGDLPDPEDPAEAWRRQWQYDTQWSGSLAETRPVKVRP